MKLSRTFSLFFLRFSAEFAILHTNEVMNLKTKYWICILGFVLIMCIGASLFVMGGEDAAQARITSDGKTIRILDLHIDQQFTVETDHGYNVVTVKDGKIAVTEASCPDHYCMDRGFCSKGAQIVCLPNLLVIRFTGMQEVDIVVG